MGLKKVNSYDIYDTIIARTMLDPTTIFDLIEKKTQIIDFKNIRMKAQAQNGQTLDTIYDRFKIITGFSDKQIEDLKEVEIQTEIENSYLILSVSNYIEKNDILVSDMYFNADQLGRILKALGFKKHNKIYSSAMGKSKADGSMYAYLLKQYQIIFHFGDNEHSDIKMAVENHIHGALIEVSKMNETEQFFYAKGNEKFAFQLRKFRHKNPYKLNTYDYHLYNDQVALNIPVLILLSKHLNDILIQENRDTVLFLTRDGCLIEHIFGTLYPAHKIVTFQSSRLMNLTYHDNEEYKAYVKKTYNHQTCLIFDLHGSFNTGRAMYMELFGHLPRVHLFIYDNYNKETFPGLSFNIDKRTQKNIDDTIELFNADTIGTLVDMKHGKFIRNKLEYNLNDVKIYRETVLQFCAYMKEQRMEARKCPPVQLLVEFYTQNKQKPHLIGFLETHAPDKVDYNVYVVPFFLLALFAVFIFRLTKQKKKYMKVMKTLWKKYIYK
jgi:hypothetical protein